MCAQSSAVAPGARSFDFVESTLLAPRLRPGTVPRVALVNRLRAAREARVATLIAPAGYGKTTLLAQWAQRDERPFAWVTVDDRDNDPIVLVRHVGTALERREPLEPATVAALRAPGPSVWSTAVPRVAAELAARAPIVLVLDEVDALRSRGALDVVGALAKGELDGSLLVLAARAAPRLPLSRLRAGGGLFELSAPDLALTSREASLLLRATGVRLGDQRVAELVGECEGWAAGLYLGALAIRDGRRRGREPARFRGDERHLADYFRSECLTRLRPGQLRFLRRTSVLDRMSGSLCDAVLAGTGSARELARVERADLFLVPLDSRREWYRYHHLFRALLLRELAEEEPELVPVLHGRAADWFEERGDAEAALEHAFAARDFDRAAALLATIPLPLHDSSRVATVEHWIDRFEQAGLLERYPLVALSAASVHALRGRAEAARSALDAASRGAVAGPLPDGSTSIAPSIATLRAWLCRAGAGQMLVDAEAALAELPADSTWRPAALTAAGAALLLLGESARADAALVDAAREARRVGATETLIVALGERALIAADVGDRALADALARKLRELVTTARIEGTPALALERATAARALLRHGRWNEARAALADAQAVLRFVTGALPWLAVPVRFELARGFLTLRDAGAARSLLDEADDILEAAPGLESLAARAAELRREIDAMPEPGGRHGSGLTTAELRLLPLLATHLSFREIGERLFVSRNTVKTQAIAVYRKLGVSSRSEAVAEVSRLGLADRLHAVVGGDR